MGGSDLCESENTFFLAVGKKVRGSQTSAENDPLVAVIKVGFGEDLMKNIFFRIEESS